MLEQMVANRRIEIKSMQHHKFKNKTEICSEDFFWDRNLGLQSNAEIA